VGEAEDGAAGVIDGGLKTFEDIADAELAVDIGEADEKGDERAQDDESGAAGLDEVLQTVVAEVGVGLAGGEADAGTIGAGGDEARDDDFGEGIFGFAP
jgi:hypothetical protein